MHALLQWAEAYTHPAPHSVHWNGDGREDEVKELSLAETVNHYASNILGLLGAFLALPFAALESISHRVYTCFVSDDNPSSSPSVLGNNAGPSEQLRLANILPPLFGIAMSVFQTTGAGSPLSANKEFPGPNQWAGRLDRAEIDGAKSKEDIEKLFVDIFKPQNAKKFSDLLASMGCRALRFSLEWAMFQPDGPEGFNQKAIEDYRNLIGELKRNHIEPFVTIHHFTHPIWFEEREAFIKDENIQHFTAYAEKMFKEFPEIKYWYTFNEVGAFTLEGWLQDHPSPIRGLDDAGNTIRNMLRAHCEVYEKAKKENQDRRIGITHQWLKLNPINPGNPLEEAVCYIASKIAHLAIYEFFKTGNFVFRKPFQTNLSFHVDPKKFEDNNGFLDHIGVQFYGPAHIILGSNGGQNYPGHRIQNFVFNFLGWGLSFGGTSIFGKPVMSFGPTVDPEALEPNLLEAIELGKEIHITEIGVDANIQHHGEEEFKEDREFQKKIFEQYVPILERYKERIGALFVWSIHAKKEWNRGDEPKLSVGEWITDQVGNIVDLFLYPAGEWLKEEFLAYDRLNKGKEEERNN